MIRPCPRPLSMFKRHVTTPMRNIGAASVG